MWPVPIPPGARKDLATSLRALVLAIGVLETAALAMFSLLMLQSSDPAGAVLGRSVATLMAVPYAVLALPGMVLACMNRWLPLALVLVVLAVPAAIALWRHA